MVLISSHLSNKGVQECRFLLANIDGFRAFKRTQVHVLSSPAKKSELLEQLTMQAHTKRAEVSRERYVCLVWLLDRFVIAFQRVNAIPNKTY